MISIIAGSRVRELFSLIAGTVLLILYVEYEVYEYTVWRRRGGVSGHSYCYRILLCYRVF